MNILLACGAGASTSLLVNKMKSVAKAQGKDYNIRAVAKAEVPYVKDVDVILLGPQVTFALENIKKAVEDQNIPVAVIKTQDYGMCDGQKVLAFAEELYFDNQKNRKE